MRFYFKVARTAKITGYFYIDSVDLNSAYSECRARVRPLKPYVISADEYNAAVKISAENKRAAKAALCKEVKPRIH